MTSLHALPTTVQYELNDLFVGPLLGRGCFREVYESALDPDRVIKIEQGTDRYFANVTEWEIWNEANRDHPEAARWLAPCFNISFSGSVLIQARTQPIKKLPPELPDFIADIKLENLGRYKGRIVVHDYGNHRCFVKALTHVRMRKVKS